MQTARPLILFDGFCHLCDRSVQFVLEHDREAVFDFAPLQSETGQSILAGRAWNSMILFDNGQLREGQDAVLRILSLLPAPWCWLSKLLALVPGPVRIWGYRVIANNRYRIFGRSEVCAMPRPEWKGRFLS